VRGFIDLHSHWVPGIDDGARSIEEGRELLSRLRKAGFDQVIATPHMRPGLFDNTRAELVEAYQRAEALLAGTPELPTRGLSSEHYFDSLVIERVMSGEGLPYPGGKALLLEFYEMEFPHSVDHQLALLRRRGLLPVIAHPERYRVLWKKPEVLERMVDVGAVALLDTAALVGKYGSAPRQAAEGFLDAGLYHAACSDAHRPEDVDEVLRGIAAIEKSYDADEVDFLFRFGPAEILAGRIPT
jgi:protein-tyrosine phosphatase